MALRAFRCTFVTQNTQTGNTDDVWSISLKTPSIRTILKGRKIMHVAGMSNSTNEEHILQRELQFSRVRVYLHLTIVIQRKKTGCNERFDDTVGIT
mmetsp:Transcript_26011/g.31901  ORF Transcript_26011/g.31901 Transcript_26011/m.31901 type:complete len:96 (+) Transcript_26011:1319-1606(+)